MSSREYYVQVIKDAARTIIKERVSKVIVTKLLSWLPTKILSAMNPLVGLIASVLADELVEGSELLAFFLYTDFRTTKQGQKVYEDMETNYQMQISGTRAQKEKAAKNLIESSRLLISLSS